MDEIIPGYTEYQDSLFAKIQELLNMYVLCKLKLQQLRMRGIPNAESEIEILKQLVASKDEVNRLLSED